MCANLILAAVVVGAAPVPPNPRPEATLVVVEFIPGDGKAERVRLSGVPFRAGKPLPVEVLWDGDQSQIEQAPWRVVADRYLWARDGSVYDFRARKFIHTETGGRVRHAGAAGVTYEVEDAGRPGVYTFDFATGALTRTDLPRKRIIPAHSRRSPDGVWAVHWEKRGAELTLWRDGAAGTSLGKGFDWQSPLGAIWAAGFGIFALVWLDNERFLTQRGNGNLVTVDLQGKVTEVLRIDGIPAKAITSLDRERTGAIVYSADDTAFYRLDLTKKTAVRCDWEDLGYGFEVSWVRDDQKRFVYRHKGKEIGRFHCRKYDVHVTAEYLALPEQPAEDADRNRTEVKVYSAASGEWTSLKYRHLKAPVGWAK